MGETLGTPLPNQPSASTTWFFAGMKRHFGPLTRSSSLDAFEDPVVDSSSPRKRGKWQRIEQWEAKGGFNIASPFASAGFRAKALTDLSMAQTMGVEPGEEIMSHISKKRSAATSALLPAGKWIFKRIRGNREASKQHNTDDDNMDVRFSLMVKVSEEATRVVIDPDQSPTSP